MFANFIFFQQGRHAIKTERIIYLRLRLNSRARSEMNQQMPGGQKFVHN